MSAVLLHCMNMFMLTFEVKNTRVMLYVLSMPRLDYAMFQRFQKIRLTNLKQNLEQEIE